MASVPATPLSSAKSNSTIKTGEYAERGDYHRVLDKNWKYYPVYVEKMRLVRDYLDGCSADERIADLGCGEGLLTEEYQGKGYDIFGLDFNFESKFVMRGDITNLDFDTDSLDRVLSLDVIEHLDFEQQVSAINEMYRVLKPGGHAMLSIPNLAHFASRCTFAGLGKLIRTSTIDRHKGDRPIGEYVDLCKQAGFRVLSRRGVFPTLPLLSIATYLAPSRVIAMHRLYNTVVRIPGICFLNLIEMRKDQSSSAAPPSSNQKAA